MTVSEEAALKQTIEIALQGTLDADHIKQIAQFFYGHGGTTIPADSVLADYIRAHPVVGYSFPGSPYPMTLYQVNYPPREVFNDEQRDQALRDGYHYMIGEKPVFPMVYVKANYPDKTVNNEAERIAAVNDGFAPQPPEAKAVVKKETVEARNTKSKEEK